MATRRRHPKRRVMRRKTAKRTSRMVKRGGDDSLRCPNCGRDNTIVIDKRDTGCMCESCKWRGKCTEAIVPVVKTIDLDRRECPHPFCQRGSINNGLNIDHPHKYNLQPLGQDENGIWWCTCLICGWKGHCNKTHDIDICKQCGHGLHGAYCNRCKKWND